jgi:hypothetical protein
MSKISTGERFQVIDIRNVYLAYCEGSEIQCPIWGYPTEDAYYRDASSANAVLAIQIPFLAIQAEDDPVRNLQWNACNEIRTDYNFI